MNRSHSLRDNEFEVWLSHINQACGRFAATTLGNRFHGSVQEFCVGALRSSVVDISQTRLYRTPKEIAQSNGGYFFTVFQLSGSAEMEQGDACTQLTAGDMTLIDAARPCSFTYHQASSQLSLILPKSYLHTRVPSPLIRCAQRLPANTSLAQLSRHLITESLGQPHMQPDESEAVLNALATLLRPALMAQNEAAPQEQLFSRVVMLIDQHIQSDSLSPEWIAREVGISVRSLYRLFARKGRVIAQYIKHRRLDFCAEILRTAPHHQKLSDIGYSWGFSDHSHFSTAFKTRFGIPPGEYRKQYRSSHFSHTDTPNKTDGSHNQ